MNEKQLMFLFENYASDKGFTDYDEFKGLMSDENARKVFFENSNPDLGFTDYDEFNNVLGVSDVEVEPVNFTEGSVEQPGQPTEPLKQNITIEDGTLKTPEIDYNLEAISDEKLSKKYGQKLTFSVDPFAPKKKEIVKESLYTPSQIISDKEQEIVDLNKEIDKIPENKSTRMAGDPGIIRTTKIEEDLYNKRRDLIKTKNQKQKQLNDLINSNEDILAAESGSSYFLGDQEITRSKLRNFATSMEYTLALEEGGKDFDIKVENDEQMKDFILSQKEAASIGLFEKSGIGFVATTKDILIDGIDRKRAELGQLLADVGIGSEEDAAMATALSSFQPEAASKAIKDAILEVNRDPREKKDFGDAFLRNYSAQIENTNAELRGIQLERSYDVIDLLQEGEVGAASEEIVKMSVESLPYTFVAMAGWGGTALIANSVQSREYYDLRNQGVSKEKSLASSGLASVIETVDAVLEAKLFKGNLSKARKIAGKTGITAGYTKQQIKDLSKNVFSSYVKEMPTELAQGTLGELNRQWATDKPIDFQAATRAGFIESLAAAPTSTIIASPSMAKLVYAPVKKYKDLSKIQNAIGDFLFRSAETTDNAERKILINQSKMLVNDYIAESNKIEQTANKSTEEESNTLKQLTLSEFTLERTLENTDNLSPETVEVLQSKLDDIGKQKSELINSIEGREDVAVEDVAAPEEVIEEQEYNQFVDEGVVSEERIQDIANKVRRQQELTPREQEIFTDKTSEVNQKIAEFTPTEEVSETVQAISPLPEGLKNARVARVGGTFDKGARGEKINEKEIEEAQSVLMDELNEIENSNLPQQQKDAASAEVEKLFNELENYEFTTETKTRKITQKRPTRVVREGVKEQTKSPQERSVGRKINIVEGTEFTQEGFTPQEGETIVLEEQDGKIVLQAFDKYGNRTTAQELELESVNDLELVETLKDDNGKVIGATVRNKNNDAEVFSIMDEELALDYAIEKTKAEVGEMNTEEESVFKEYEEVKKIPSTKKPIKKTPKEKTTEETTTEVVTEEKTTEESKSEPKEATKTDKKITEEEKSALDDILGIGGPKKSIYTENKSEADTRRLKRVDAALNKIQDSFQKIFPNLYIGIAEDSDMFAKFAEEQKTSKESRSKGVFTPIEIEGEPKRYGIILNPDFADVTTAFHEAFHALMKVNGFNNEQARAVTSRMIKSVQKGATPGLNESLEIFVSQYKTPEQSEEYMSELFGILAYNYSKQSGTVKGIIKRWLRKLAEIIGLKPKNTLLSSVGLSDSDAATVKMLNVLADKMSRGKVLSKEDVTALRMGGPLTAQQVAADMRMDEEQVVGDENLPEGVKFQVDAWHGSPYMFDKFTTGAIGTGEGVQAFGWGLYFTDLESIAKNYADKLTPTKVIIDGKTVDRNKNFFLYKAAYDIANLGYEGAVERNKELISDGDSDAKDILGTIEGLKEKDVKFGKDANVYKVSLHKGKSPSEYTWLEWDKPLSSSNKLKLAKAFNIPIKVDDSKVKNIRKRLEEAINNGDSDLVDSLDLELLEAEYDFSKNGIGPIVSEIFSKEGINLANSDGHFLYNQLTRKLKSDKEASLFLLRAGIDGIKYLAESISRGATSDTARGFNYVVFDENAVSIEEVVKLKKSKRQPKIDTSTSSKSSSVEMFENPDILKPERMDNGRTKVIDLGRAFDKRAKENGYYIPIPKDGVYTDNQLNKIAEAMTDDAQQQLQQDDSGIGWYDLKTKSAMELMSRIHPELSNSNSQPHLEFTVLVALISQNNSVGINFRQANEAYTYYKNNNKLPEKPYAGKSGNIIKQNIALAFEAIKSKGWTKFKNTLQENRTVKEWEAEGYNISGENKTTKITGGMAIFGSKIGSFWGNLNGDFNTLTADLWFSRNFNRYTGNVVSKKGNVKSKQTTLDELKKYNGTSLLYGYKKSDILKGTEVFDKWLNTIVKNYADKNYKDKQRLNVVSNTHFKNTKGELQDIPRGGNERNTMRDVVKRVQDKLIERGYPKLDIADIQAILWYNEKDLYALYKAVNKSSEKTDYETAAQEVLRNQGVNAEVALPFQRSKPSTDGGRKQTDTTQPKSLSSEVKKSKRQPEENKKLKDAIEFAKDNNIPLKELNDYLLNNGYTQQEIDEATPVESKPKESIQKLINKISRLTDNNEARAIVAKELRELLKDSKLSQFSKRTINKVITSLKNTNVSNMQKMLDKVEDAISDDEGRVERIKRYKDRSRAIKRIANIGPLKELQDSLVQMLGIDPKYLSEDARKEYDTIISDILNINRKYDKTSRDTFKAKIDLVLNSYNIDSLRAKAIADRINELIDTTKTLNTNLARLEKDGYITKEERELITRFKSLLDESSVADPMAGYTEEEIELYKEMIKAEKREAIEQDFIETLSQPQSAFYSTDDAGAFKLSEEERSYIKEANSITLKDIQELSLSDAKSLVRALEAMKAGFLVPGLFQGVIKVRGVRGNMSIPLTEIKESGFIDKISSKISSSILNRGRKKKITGIGDRLRSAPTKNYEQVLKTEKELLSDGSKRFKATNIYTSLFKPTSSAFSKSEQTLTKIEDKLKNATALLSRNQNERFIQKAKVMVFQIQREHDSNLGNKEVNQAKDWINATIKDKDTKYKENEIRELEKIRDGYLTDDQVDANKLYDSLTTKEKKFLETIDGVYDELTSMARIDANAQGMPFIHRENYIHLPKSGTNTTEISNDLDSLLDSFMNASVKNKAAIQRTGKTHSISFDPVSNAYAAARKISVGYHMYPVIKSARVAFSGLKNRAETEFQKNLVNELESIYDKIINSQYKNVTKDKILIDNIINYLTKAGYYSQLGGLVKAASELGSNTLHAVMNHAGGIVDGYATIVGVDTKTIDKALENTQTTQMARLTKKAKFENKDVESKLMSKEKLFNAEEMTGELAASAKTVGKVAALPFKAVAKLNESLITKPDELVIRPLFVGVFQNKFRQLTGQKLNWEKLANDESYRDRFQEAINQASEEADTAVIDTAASINPFDTIPNNISDPDAGAIKKAMQIINRYMTNFRVFEYYSAVKGVQNLLGKGEISRGAGSMLLASTLTRMAIYRLGIDYAFGLIFSMLGMGEDEDEIKEEDITRSVLSGIVTLSFGRNLGNLSQTVINFGIEYANKEFGEGITWDSVTKDGEKTEYDPYKDSMVFSKISVKPSPGQNVAVNAAIGFTGPLAPVIKTTVRGVTLANRSINNERKESRDKNRNELFFKTPFDMAGSTGFIPDYKDLKRINDRYWFGGDRDTKKEVEGKSTGRTVTQSSRSSSTNRTAPKSNRTR